MTEARDIDETKAAFAEASGTIGSRFESQKTVDEVRERKDREWKEAYARIGQEPPKQEEFVDDGRTLYERLQINKQAKTEEWDAKMKLGNQYRGLDTEEQKFLMDKLNERKAEERKREEAENAEIAMYRERLAAKNTAIMSEPQPTASTSKPVPAERKPAMPIKAPKKDVKSLMKGIVVKKKPKPPPSAAQPAQPAGSSHHNAITGSQPNAPATAKRKAEDGSEGSVDKKAKSMS